jgi:hypothetical protein
MTNLRGGEYVMKELVECGCLKVSNWYLDEYGKVKLDYPESIANVPGVLIIANDTEVMYIAGTSHYGPRIKDFVHSIKGETSSARIHKHIAGYLATGNKDLMLWRKDNPNHNAAKAEMKVRFCAKWSRG